MSKQCPSSATARFGRYRLIRNLGAGGMGHVYKALFEGPNGFVRYVAVKRILTEHARDPRFVRMLSNEAKIISLLSHPNIVSVYELGDVHGELFIAMEYVCGWDCRQLGSLACQQGALLPPQIAAYIVQQVARGLQYAHGYVDEHDQPRVILHRDISPQNIMVDRQGLVKLVDFGIAKAVAAQEEAGSLMLQGKVAYMAPELWEEGVYTPQTDIFSAGVVLHELLTGQRLFLGKTVEETIHQVKTAPVTAPNAVRPEVSSALSEITMRALARAPAQRYQHAMQLEDALSTVLNQAQFSTEKTKAWLKQICPKISDEAPPMELAHVVTAALSRPELGPDPYLTRSVQVQVKTHEDPTHPADRSYGAGEQTDTLDASDLRGGPQVASVAPVAALSRRTLSAMGTLRPLVGMLVAMTIMLPSDGSCPWDQIPVREAPAAPPAVLAQPPSVAVAQHAAELWGLSWPCEGARSAEPACLSVVQAALQCSAVRGSDETSGEAKTVPRSRSALTNTREAHRSSGLSNAPAPGAALPSAVNPSEPSSSGKPTSEAAPPTSPLFEPVHEDLADPPFEPVGHEP